LRITAPKNQRFDKAMIYSLYKKVKENQKTATYEGIFSICITRELLQMKKSEFMKFYKEIEVKGGMKRRKGNNIIIQPRRNKAVSFRLSEEQFAILKKLADNAEMSVSDYIYETILQVIMKAVKEAQEST